MVVNLLSKIDLFSTRALKAAFLSISCSARYSFRVLRARLQLDWLRLNWLNVVAATFFGVAVSGFFSKSSLTNGLALN